MLSPLIIIDFYTMKAGRKRIVGSFDCRL